MYGASLEHTNLFALFLQTVTRLKAFLDQTDVVYNEKVFNTSAGITGLGPNPFVSMIISKQLC